MELWGRPQKPFASTAHRLLSERWCDEWGDPPGSPCPSVQAVQRYIHSLSEKDKILSRNTGSAAREQLKTERRAVTTERPFDEVHADGWTSHFTAPHPTTGRFVTYEIWHFHDIVTRYVTPVSIGLTENTDVILRGLENCIRFGGHISRLQTDSTGSVKNERVENESMVGLEARLAMTIIHPQTVGNSQANGIAESFNRYLDECAKQLATYQNPNKMDSGVFKKVGKVTRAMVRAQQEDGEKRAKLKALAERTGSGLVFETTNQAIDWINGQVDRFNNSPHSELPMVADPLSGKRRRMTPAEYLADWRRRGWEPMHYPEVELVDAFRPHFKRTVVRCVVTVMGQRYHHPELDHVTGLDVLVAVDMDDASRVWIKDLDGNLLCEAAPQLDVPYRSESFREMTDRKRLEARIKSKEKAIERDIAETMGLPAIEASATEVFELPQTLVRQPELQVVARVAEVIPQSHDDVIPEGMTEFELACLQIARDRKAQRVADEQAEMAEISARLERMKRDAGEETEDYLRPAMGDHDFY